MDPTTTEEVTVRPRINVDFYVVADQAYIESSPGTKLGAHVFVGRQYVEIPDWKNQRIYVEITASLREGRTNLFSKFHLPRFMVEQIQTKFLKGKKTT
jgi:hypothetical protein